MSHKKEFKTLKNATQVFQRREVEQRLLAFDGNRLQTAQSLGISRQHLNKLIHKFNITIPPQVQYLSASRKNKSKR